MESLNLFVSVSLLCISPFVLYYALQVNVIHKHRILIHCHKYLMTIISTMASTMNDSELHDKSQLNLSRILD